MKWKQLGLALAALSVFGLANANSAAAANPPILTWGGDVFVKFIGYSAVLRSELWFFGNTNPGPDQTPFQGTTQYSGTYLFPNQDPQASAAPGKVGTMPLGSPTGNLNTVAYGGPFAQNSVLNFGLFVQDLYAPGYTNNVVAAEAAIDPTVSNTRGAWFYSGLASNNVDNRIHTVVTQVGAYHYIVGFEDLCKDPTVVASGTIDCTNTRFTADWDFNDHVFEVYSNPEPVSMTLIGTGLVGIAGMVRRRRRGQKSEA